MWTACNDHLLLSQDFVLLSTVLPLIVFDIYISQGSFSCKWLEHNLN